MIRILAILAAFLAAASPTFATADNIWLNRQAGMVGGWDFSGHRTFSPDGTTLTLFGNAAVTGGTRYLSMDGSGDYSTWTSSPSQAFSLSIWVYKTTTNTECWLQHARVSSYDATNSGLRLVAGNGFSFFDIYGSVGTLTQANGVAPTINGWTHYVATYNSGTLKTYQNGVLRNTTVGTNYTMTSGASQIGRWASSGGSFYATGRVGSLLPFNRVLTDAEATRLFNEGTARIAGGGTP